MTRKRKHLPPTQPQLRLLQGLLDRGATSRDTAVSITGELNPLNRLFMRGWVGRTPAPRAWWLTEAGALALSGPAQADGLRAIVVSAGIAA